MQITRYGMDDFPPWLIFLIAENKLSHQQLLQNQYFSVANFLFEIQFSLIFWFENGENIMEVQNPSL